MPRPVTLFTGQFADIPIAELAKKAKAWGYDGLELACWSDHFEVDKAVDSDGYIDFAPSRVAFDAAFKQS
jgi:sugar phosphate isomerase/epimerase